MAEIEVSVCMITYNHAEFIKKAIQGVLNQKIDFPMELIISDDASTDETIDFVNESLKNITTEIKIKIIRNSENLGVSRNFANALNACSGKYIAICEGDDYWLDQNKIQTQYNFLEDNPGFVMSFHDGLVEQNDIIHKNILNSTTKRDLIFDDLVTGYFTIPTLTVFFRNILKNKIPREFYEITNCDTFLYLLLSKYGEIHFHKEINEVVHVYHKGGIWSMKDSIYRSKRSYNTYKQAYQFFKDKRLYIPIVNFGNSLIIYSWKDKNLKDLLKYYFSNICFSLKYYPAFRVFLRKHKDFFRKKLNS